MWLEQFGTEAIRVGLDLGRRCMSHDEIVRIQPRITTTGALPSHVHFADERTDLLLLVCRWYDRDDTWESFLSNMHNQIRIAEYQHCGFFHSPDMLTIGMGGQTRSQYRAQMLMYVTGHPCSCKQFLFLICA
jgi:hypothetical protein